MKNQRNVLVFVIFVFLLCLTVNPLFAAEKSKPIIIKLSDQLNIENPQYKAHMYFADLVKEKTNGAIEVQVFPNSQLGNARESLEGTLTGVIEMTKAAAAAVSPFVKELSVFSLPYVFTNKEDIFKALDGKVGQILNKKLEDAGFKLISYYDAGFRHVLNSKRPINRLEDLKGLKIRVMGDPIMIESFNTLGALATPIAYAELYSALKQGVVDGAENPVVAIYAMKFYEVTKYLSLTNHFYDLNLVVMGKKFFDEKLTSEQQKIILESGKETQIYERQLWADLEKDAIGKLEEGGMVVNTLDLIPFQKAVADIIEKSKSIIGADLLEEALSVSEK